MTTVELIDRLNHLYKIAQAVEAGQPIEVYVPNREMWVVPDPEGIAYLLADALHPSDDGEPPKFRIAPKPEPKMPSGVFFVRFREEPDETYLPVRVTEDAVYILAADHVMLRMCDLAKNYTWSRDRVTWFTFDNHGTPVTQ